MRLQFYNKLLTTVTDPQGRWTSKERAKIMDGLSWAMLAYSEDERELFWQNLRQWCSFLLEQQLEQFIEVFTTTFYPEFIISQKKEIIAVFKESITENSIIQRSLSFPFTKL